MTWILGHYVRGHCVYSLPIYQLSHSNILYFLNPGYISGYINTDHKLSSTSVHVDLFMSSIVHE